MATNDRTGAATAAESGDVTVTWMFTETYTQQLSLRQVAAVTGHTVAALMADPAELLCGAVPDRLADLLAGHQHEDSVTGVPDVEIVAAYRSDQPTLADLTNAAHRALLAEPGLQQHTRVGHALSALLAGLHREQVINR